MNIKKNLVSTSKYKIKCPYSMKAEFIVVHNTANDASAADEIAYMIRNNNEVSFHYAIDNKQIVQGIPETRNAWHAGDGENGKGNRKGIAVEICYSKSGGAKFTAAEKLAAEFIASKLKEKGWGIDKVKKHKDFSGKNCPHRTISLGWQRFLDMVQAELDELNALDKPSDVNVSMPVLSKGDSGVVVRNAMLILKDRGYYTAAIPASDKLFGAKMEAAVKALQKKHGLTADGVIGAKTWPVLLRK